MGVRTHEPRETGLTRRTRNAAGAAAAAAVFAAALVLLLSNGRPIGEPDGRGAAGWLWRGAVALSAALIEPEATGSALIGKLLAAACAALAAAALFAAAARRHPLQDARWAAFTLALGSTLAAAAQAWSGEAAATAAVALALWLLARAEDESAPALAARAGLPLALAAALQPTALPLAVVLMVAVVVRWRESGPPLLAWAAAGAIAGILGWVAAAARSPAGAAGAAEAFLSVSPGDHGAAALLFSPAKGALLFVPAALVGLAGLARALRSGRVRRLWDQALPTRALPAACAVGFAAHLATVAFAGGWSQGVFWGPRLLAPAWPLLLLFVPEGLALLKLPGTLLVVLSVAVQALGAFSYDGRWDRLERDRAGRLDPASAWSPARSPAAFQLRERVLRASLPGLEGRRLVVHERALVVGGVTGSFVSLAEGRVRPVGADAVFEALRLEQGARVEGERLQLRLPGDGIAFRVRDVARLRRLELRVAGRGQGTLALAEKSFWRAPRVRERAVSGAFRLRLPYAFADSRAADVALTLRGGGPVAIESVALVPPSEPENVIRLP